MSSTIEYHESKLTGFTQVLIFDEIGREYFKELVQRGANLWPDAPASIKEFADLVTSGSVLQDYKSQEKKPI